MKKIILSSAITLSALAGTALAQPGLYASGLLHQPLGNAQAGPVDGRRIPYHNIGSSGQDGVEISMHSVEGGAVALDLGAFLQTPGSELRIRHKGWDGLIYGNHRVISNGDGTAIDQFDFSQMGATTINVRTLSVDGIELSNENFPGPIFAKPWVPDWFCADGSFPVYWERWVVLCNTCNPVWVRGWSCPATGQDFSFNSMRMIVTPQTPAGSPPVPPLESSLVTVSNLPSLTVIGAELSMTGTAVHGVGGAHISQSCDDTTCATTHLSITNLGSSGQDGVSIDLGPSAGGAELEMGRGNCCRGHVTLMKAYDDEGAEQRLIRTILDVTPDGGTVEEIDRVFPSMQSDGFILKCYGPGGVVIGPVGGTAIINGGPRPIFTNRCPNGGMEIWTNTGTPGNPVWTFMGCDNSTNIMMLPNGQVLFGVTSYSTQPLNPVSPPSSAKIRHVVITRNGSEMELRSARALPLPPTCGSSDFNGDGDYGTDADIEAFFACLGGSCCSTCFSGGSDFNADGDYGTDADIESFFRVLGGGPC